MAKKKKKKTILLNGYGQLVIKRSITNYGHLPEQTIEKIIFLLKLFLDPFILSGFVSAFVASLCWMAAMTKFELSYAYPFMGLTFVVVFISSVFLFSESVTLYKILGLALIVLGIFISSRA